MARWLLLGSWCCSTPTTCASYTFKFLRKLFFHLASLLSLSLGNIYAHCFTLVVIVGTDRMHSSSSRRGMLHLYILFGEIRFVHASVLSFFYKHLLPSPSLPRSLSIPALLLLSLSPNVGLPCSLALACSLRLRLRLPPFQMKVEC